MKINSGIAGDQSVEWSLNTIRLTMRRAKPCQRDIALLLELWSDPAVMCHVGFPSGLRTSSEKIEQQLREQKTGEFDCVLIIMISSTIEPIGQCELGYPDAAGVAHTDIKLLPKYWGNGYGKEIKLALLEYLFSHTACQQVRVTPNKYNIASIKLQESVGGHQTGEGLYQFPERMRDYTTEVRYFEYTVFREDWIKAHLH
jgi:RimJ/RimL family protein N-acetyltransferase